jgi:hypothetical protein
LELKAEASWLLLSVSTNSAAGCLTQGNLGFLDYPELLTQRDLHAALHFWFCHDCFTPGVSTVEHIDLPVGFRRFCVSFRTFGCATETIAPPWVRSWVTVSLEKAQDFAAFFAPNSVRQMLFYTKWIPISRYPFAASLWVDFAGVEFGVFD